ncbi:hypothetical protein HIM_11047 [Hirsutella minnesotensis 3608]|uniref:Reverse transcriptase n=1 Tax=Hirsutella minnesotensis 3608 TaxID=1043627 RepID=A0A0F8A1M6_9HYPO|nr:hypothetical protein HIM_11047 [Hirsutella minnesotensis 3608]
MCHTEPTCLEARVQMAKEYLDKNPDAKLATIAREFEVPRGRLRSRLQGRSSLTDSQPTNTKLSKPEEDALCRYVDRLDSVNLAVRREFIVDAANRILRERSGKASQSDPPVVGIHWIDRFVKRHKYRLMSQKQLELNRQVAEDIPTVVDWFNKLRSVLQSEGIADDDIWNMDETGFRIGVGKDQLVVTKRKKAHYFGTPGNRESATAIECISAGGRVLPAFLVLCGIQHRARWYEVVKGYPDTRIAMSPTGYSNDEICLEWIYHFDEHTKKKSKGNKRLLILDGFGSHHTYPFIEYCRRNGIVLFSLPPHLTHLLQPLDVVVFQPLKHYHAKAVDLAVRDGCTDITKVEFLDFIQDVRKKTFRHQTILSAFRKTGIVPFNQEVVLAAMRARKNRTPSPELDSALQSSPFDTPTTLRQMHKTASHLEDCLIAAEDCNDGSILLENDFLVSMGQFIRGAISNSTELVQTKRDLGRTRLAEKTRQLRRAMKNRPLQSGGVLTVAQGRHMAARKEEIEFQRAQRKVEASRARYDKALKGWYLEAAKRARAMRMARRLGEMLVYSGSHGSPALLVTVKRKPEKWGVARVRQAGAQLFAQQKRQTPEHNVPEQSRQSPDSSQSRSSESQAAGEDGSSSSSATEERAAPSPPCIVVATTPPQFTPVVRKTLRIFQANVGKIPAAHDTALALADSERFDLVLLQEPWTGLKNGRCLTKTHPAYDTFSSVTDWDSRDTRPRVMTYVRRSAGLVADQKRPAATRDILWLTVNGVTVVNFYRQPDYDVALEILLRWNATDKCLVSGDFNAKHPSWQAGRQEHRGEDIAFWAMDNRLGLLNAVDVPTNARGNTIDLAFSNIPLADVVVEDHLATGSDHFTLSITLPGQDLAPLPLCKIRLNTDEELKRFIELVEAGTAFIPTATSSPSELDNFASALVNLLGCAARAAGRPVLKTTHGALWWTEECAKAAANYRAWRRVYPLGFDREVQLAKRELYNVEAFARKQVATLVTLDIQGAFDTVLCNRLVLRLREQGWPSNLARWVGSFMQDRSARIRYQDIVTDSSPLQCGLPQGSPVSPILFLLYTEPIYRLGNSKGRFGYADDTAILCVGDSLDETSAEASHHVRELLSWGAANGISFDPDKTEVIHFSRTKPKTAPPVLHGEIEKSPDRAMRWLGVWLDSTLSFKTHVEKWTAKAQAVAFHLRTLTNTKHGPLPSAVRRAVCACVIPVLLYAVEAWYPSSTSPRWTKPEKDGPSRIGHLVKKMSKALYTSLRAILPVWRTTPTNVLHREAGIPPVSLLLDARRMAFAARLKALDEAHPLVKRTLRPKAPVVNTMIKLKYQKQPQPFRTRLRRADELLPSCPRPALLQRGFAEEQTAPLQNATKDKAAKEFRDWLQALSPRTLVVYSDGSRSTEGHVGYGYAVHRNGSTILSGKGRLGPAEVFDAEAKGALEGLKAAVSFSETDRIFVCLDNLAAATCLRGTPSDSSQEVFLQFQAIAREHGAVEEADALAKAGASLPEPADNAPTLARLRKIARQRPKEAFKTWWQTSAPEQYRNLDLTATTGCPPELTLSWPLLHHLLAARTRHGDFADYHERFDHHDALLTCSCGRRKDPTHIFYCRKVAPRHRVRLTPSPSMAISRAIGKDFDKFVQLAKASSFFAEICLRH